MTKHNNIRLGGTAKNLEDVEAIHSLGLQFAEIHIMNPWEFSDSVDQYLEVKERLGLKYLCHGPREGDPSNAMTLEQRLYPNILSTLTLMKKLDISLLTMHLWMDPRFVKPDVIDFKIKLLKRITQRASDEGIIVCLENLSENASDLKRPFKEVPLLNMTLDMGHAQLLTNSNNSEGFFDIFPDRIKHIHVHDNRGGNSYRDDLHLPVGEGIIDFEVIFKKLKSVGYENTITLELPPDQIKKCLKNVMDMLSIT